LFFIIILHGFSKDFFSLHEFNFSCFILIFADAFVIASLPHSQVCLFFLILISFSNKLSSQVDGFQ